MADLVSDQVLTVLRQVEIDLEALVDPKPTTGIPEAPPWDDEAAYDLWIDDEPNITGYKDGVPMPTSNLVAVETLLVALYQINFVREIGTSLPVLLNRVRDLLRDLADKLGPNGVLGGAGLDIPSAVAGLTTFLTAIQKLPGSPPELTEVGDALTQITGLLEDIPSTRLELYRIAQQIKAFSDAFASPGP